MKCFADRYPFLMVDRILKIEGTRIAGVKNVTSTSPTFRAFPVNRSCPACCSLRPSRRSPVVAVQPRMELENQVAYFMSAESEMAPAGVSRRHAGD